MLALLSIMVYRGHMENDPFYKVLLLPAALSLTAWVLIVAAFKACF